MSLIRNIARRLPGRRTIREIGSWPAARQDAVALTFDDGPSPWTIPILDMLAAAGGHATFFVLGDSIPGYEDVLIRMRAEGHEVGNHTRTHPWLNTLEPAAVREELDFTSSSIEGVLGNRPRLFRAPHFAGTEQAYAIAASLGLETAVYASVCPEDWRIDSGAEIAAHVLSQVARGSIIDLHDGRPAQEPPEESRSDREPTVEAVRLLVPALVEAGFQLVTVSELLEL